MHSLMYKLYSKLDIIIAFSKQAYTSNLISTATDRINGDNEFHCRMVHCYHGVSVDNIGTNCILL